MKFRDGDAREIAIIKYAEYAELDIAAIRQLYPRRDVHHFTPETKRIVRNFQKKKFFFEIFILLRKHFILIMNLIWKECILIV
jgi:hypothetical protein